MDTERARKAMVDSQVRPNDVPDLKLQKAMLTLPREMFVPANRRALAYIEKDVPLFEGRYLLKARDFSKLVHATRIKPTDLVLDVGCGYGYSAAVMAHLASVVVGLEESAEVTGKATELLSDYGLDNAAMVEGPLVEGCENQGPYDVIIVEGGVEDNLGTLLKQLSPEGGRLAAIMMRRGGLGQATLFTRTGDVYGERVLFEAYPAGVLPGFEAEKTFDFASAR